MRRKRSEQDEARLEMTPMIDVVFQLLIFFIVSIQFDDILSRFAAARPGISSGHSDLVRLEIDIGREGLAVGGRTVNPVELDAQLSRVAQVAPQTTVLLTCTPDSAHGRLVQALDACAKAGLERLAVMSR